MARVACSPSITGIFMSIRISEWSCRRAHATASSPSLTPSTTSPAFTSRPRATAWQAVTQAKLQNIPPFSLTIYCSGSSHLPAIFGSQHCALLHRPGLLPAELRDWTRRLVSH